MLLLLPLVVLCIPLLLMVALTSPEVFLIKRERQTISRYLDRAQRWIVGDEPNQGSSKTLSSERG
jgi:hypothetical protein